MNIRQFLAAVLPEQGEYYILSGNGKLASQPVDSIDTALETIKSLPDTNIYISIGSFEPGTSRQGEHALHKKAFYLDLDCGEGKEYPNQQAALSALEAWLEQTSFVHPTLLVSSGYGIHVYWCLDETLDAANWAHAAKAFKEFTTATRFRCDTAVTADVARVLRVPMTYNHKRDTPVECSVVWDKGKTCDLETFIEQLPYWTVPDNVKQMFKSVSLDDLIYSSHPDRQEPRFFSEVVKQCGTLDLIYQSHGKDSSYVEWFNVLNFLAFCEDGDRFAHHISYGHSDYDIEETQKKWEKVKQDRDNARLKGATICSSFESCRPEVCGACPHKKDPGFGVDWKSPMHFGRPSDPVNDTPPYPYTKTSQGMARTKTDKDGVATDKVVIHGICVDRIEILRNEDGSEKFVCQARRLDKRGLTKQKEQWAFKEDDLTSLGTISAALIGNQVHLHTPEKTEFLQMATEWHKRIRLEGRFSPAMESYGWIKNGKELGFATNRIIQYPDNKVVETPPPDRTLATLFEPGGTEDGWRNCVAKALKADHIETEVMLATAFAAPLVNFTSVKGCLVSAVSAGSGTGKTTAMHLAQSVWGEPIGAIQSMNDTANSVSKRMGILNNLPIYWDEIRIRGGNDKEGMAFIDFLYHTTQGREKSRMTKDTDLRKLNTWSTMLLCSSNHPLQEMMSNIDTHTAAGALRVFEFVVSPLDESKMHPPWDFADLDDNYGHIGPLYAQWLVDNADEVKSNIRHLMQVYSQKLNCGAKERFLLSTIVTLLAGAAWAKELGFVDFNLEKMETFLMEQYIRITGNVNEEVTTGRKSAIGHLSAYMKAHARHCIVTDTLGSQANRPRILSEAKEPPVYIRVVENDGALSGVYVVTSDFREWVSKLIGSSGNNTVRKLIENHKAVKQRTEMYRGLTASEYGGTRAYHTLFIPKCIENVEIFGGD